MLVHCTRGPRLIPHTLHSGDPPSQFHLVRQTKYQTVGRAEISASQESKQTGKRLKKSLAGETYIWLLGRRVTAGRKMEQSARAVEDNSRPSLWGKTASFFLQTGLQSFDLVPLNSPPNFQEMDSDWSRCLFLINVGEKGWVTQYKCGSHRVDICVCWRNFSKKVLGAGQTPQRRMCYTVVAPAVVISHCWLRGAHCLVNCLFPWSPANPDFPRQLTFSNLKISCCFGPILRNS